jgi:hypothetical protein
MMRTLKAWLVLRTLPLLALVITVATVLMLLLLSAAGFVVGSWLNPATVVVGVAFESLLSSRSHPEGHEHQQPTHQWFGRLDFFVQVLLWVCAITILVRHP